MKEIVKTIFMVFIGVPILIVLIVVLSPYLLLRWLFID